MTKLTHCQPRKPVRRPGATRVVVPETELAARRFARAWRRSSSQSPRTRSAVLTLGPAS